MHIIKTNKKTKKLNKTKNPVDYKHVILIKIDDLSDNPWPATLPRVGSVVVWVLISLFSFSTQEMPAELLLLQVVRVRLGENWFVA